MTWSCEKFSDYILGSKFEIETDFKPLVALLSNKHLNDLATSKSASYVSD
jgi:hypothetical protein